MNIFQKKGYGEQNKKVIFLLAGWSMKLWTLWPAAKILEKNGFYCICYTYDNEVFSPNIPKTVESLILIKNDILNSIKELKKHGYTDFFVAGGSLGSIIAFLVANESKDVSKIILNTTVGSDPAKNIWVSKITKWSKFKEELIKQGYTLDKFKKAWMPVSPMHNMDNLKNKKILVYLSKKDKIIPFPIGMELIDEFEKRNYNYQLVVNNIFDHFLTTIYNSFRSSIYLKFLDQDN